MLNAILSTLKTMAWLGVVLAILVIVNTVCGILCNINNGESFSWNKLFKGLLKALIFYVSSGLTAVAFTMLPYINDMIIDNFGVVLLSTELLNTLSSVAVLSIVIAVIVMQGKKAVEGIADLSQISLPKEEITWEVEEVKEIEEEEEEA